MIDSPAIVPRPPAIISLEPMIDNNVYSVGLFLTLTCVVEFPDYVDSPLTLSATWTRDSATLATTGDQLMINDFTMTSTRRYESTVQYSPLTIDLIANDTLYMCDVIVTPQVPTYITGTTTDATTIISVEGRL